MLRNVLAWAGYLVIRHIRLCFSRCCRAGPISYVVPRIQPHIEPRVDIVKVGAVFLITFLNIRVKQQNERYDGNYCIDSDLSQLLTRQFAVNLLAYNKQSIAAEKNAQTRRGAGFRIES